MCRKLFQPFKALITYVLGIVRMNTDRRVDKIVILCKLHGVFGGGYVGSDVDKTGKFTPHGAFDYAVSGFVKFLIVNMRMGIKIHCSASLNALSNLGSRRDRPVYKENAYVVCRRIRSEDHTIAFHAA